MQPVLLLAGWLAVSLARLLVRLLVCWLAYLLDCFVCLLARPLAWFLYLGLLACFACSLFSAKKDASRRAAYIFLTYDDKKRAPVHTHHSSTSYHGCVSVQQQGLGEKYVGYIGYLVGQINSRTEA